jgi:hypothetical protein
MWDESIGKGPLSIQGCKRNNFLIIQSTKLAVNKGRTMIGKGRWPKLKAIRNSILFVLNYGR